MVCSCLNGKKTNVKKNIVSVIFVMIFTNPFLLILAPKEIKLGDNKLCFLKFVIILFSLSFVFILNLSFNYNSINAYGHTLFGNNNGSAVQIQKNGNFQVELSTIPPKPLLYENTDILLRITSTAGDELIELPVYLSLVKDGKINNTSSLSNLTMVRGGHYNFNTVFSDSGKYLLFLDIRDIYYTSSTLHFIFELNVDVPIIDQFYDMLKTFFMNYYYIYIPIIILIFVLIFRYHKKQKLIKNGVR